jgi:copper(I)-binding protein
MRFLSLLLMTAVLLATASAFAGDYKVGNIEITRPWIRATPPSAPSGGGFATITNTGDTADLLVSAASPIAGRADFHAMKITDGVAKMRHLPDGIEIPAGETVELKPGSLHIMFLKLTGPIKQGESIPVTLTFEKAGPIEVEMVVTPPGAPGPEAAHGHEGGQ